LVIFILLFSYVSAGVWNENKLTEWLLTENGELRLALTAIFSNPMLNK
jgi:hypothetical protein